MRVGSDCVVACKVNKTGWSKVMNFSQSLLRKALKDQSFTEYYDLYNMDHSLIDGLAYVDATTKRIIVPLRDYGSVA